MEKFSRSRIIDFDRESRSHGKSQNLREKLKKKWSPKKLEKNKYKNYLFKNIEGDWLGKVTDFNFRSGWHPVPQNLSLNSKCELSFSTLVTISHLGSIFQESVQLRIRSRVQNPLKNPYILQMYLHVSYPLCRSRVLNLPQSKRIQLHASKFARRTVRGERVPPLRIWIKEVIFLSGVGRSRR